MQQQLRSLVVFRSGYEQLRVAHRRGLGADGGVHLLADPALGKRCEVGLGAGSEGSRRFDQAERALLDEVRHRKTLVLAPLGEADHHAEVGGHQPVQAGAIAQR